MFTFAGAGLAIVLVSGLLCMTLQGFPQRFPKQTQEFANAKSDMSFIKNFTTAEIRDGKLAPIGATNPTLRPAVLVWGDSHAMAALPAIDAFLKERGIAGRAATHSSTAPVLNWFQTRDGLKEGAIAFNDAVFSYIQSQHIHTVILVAFWSSNVGSGGDSSDSFDAALLETVQRLVAIDAHPWILLDVPIPNFDVPRTLSLSVASRANITTIYTNLAAQNEFDKINPKTIAKIKVAGGRILDPKPRFLDPIGRHYIVQANGVALYRDGQHLTTKGAKLMLLPLLRDSMTLKK